MSILWALAVRHLRLNKKRTIITVIGIVLSVAIVTAISGMIVSFQDMMYRDSVAQEGLWHVRYSGLSPAVAEQVAAEPVFSHVDREEGEEGIVLSLQFRRLHKGVFDESEAVCFRYGIEQEQVRYHNNLLIAKGIVPGPYYNALYSFAAVLLVLVAVASVLVISNAFSISAAERSRQFGLLKSAGATKKQIRTLVLLEGVALAGIAVPPGILAGLLAEGLALAIANLLIGRIRAVNFAVQFHLTVSGWMLAVAVVCAVVTVLLAAWFPAARAARVSAIDAIRQTQSVKLSPHSVKASPLAACFFGLEGNLAVKNMKRSRGRYRTTVVSLVVSIVLFIGVASFGQMLLKATGMVYADYGSNLLIALYGEDKARQEHLAAELSTGEGVAVSSYRQLEGRVQLAPEQLTQETVEYLASGTGERAAHLYSFSDADFAKICRELRLDPQAYTDPDHPRAILINTTGTYILQGRRMNFVPYRIRSGTQIAVQIDGQDVPLEIQGELGDIPPAAAVAFSANALNLVVSEPVRAALKPADQSDWLGLVVMAEDPDGYEQAAEELLGREMEEGAWRIINFEAMVANNRNIVLLVMIFVYGFIALLSLIGVTNVITTISTGVALRRREFAMLRSVGITQGGIQKILWYESLLYGVKSLVWGIPIGLLACLLMYRSLGQVMDFPFIWPISSILVSIGAVAVLCFCTTALAGNKQRRENIVDALRKETA